VALRFEDLTETSEGYRVLIRRSKTDQEGQGQVIAIPRGCSCQVVRVPWGSVSMTKAGPSPARSASTVTALRLPSPTTGGSHRPSSPPGSLTRPPGNVVGGRRRQLLPYDFAELSAVECDELRRTQCRKTLVAAFWKQAELAI
jgi:hypothetical protein